MSIAAMAAAWECPVTPGEKLILLALADCSGMDRIGTVDLREVEGKTGMTAERLSERIKKLVRKGYISYIGMSGDKDVFYLDFCIEASGEAG